LVHLPFLASFASSDSYLAFLQQLHLLEAFLLHLPFLASFASSNPYLAFLHLHLHPSFTKPFSSYLTYLEHLLCLNLITI
jgi:phosphatidylinositol kinase/protein kinase (PI-3  family)